ncbi:hypothetical protein VCHA37P193_30140 [Vibrio chagasii]|nr:hypothetical protein VCHA37P193_30140 [Vibrio chagasii]
MALAYVFVPSDFKPREVDYSFTQQSHTTPSGVVTLYKKNINHNPFPQSVSLQTVI